MLFDQFVGLLVENGVRCINVLFDLLNLQMFEQIIRCGKFDKVLFGIDVVLDVGFKFKINIVVMKYENFGELLDMIEWVYSKGMDLILIEVMLFGDIGEDWID